MKEGVSGYFDLLSDKSGVTLRFHYKETYDIETAKSNLSIIKIQLKSASWMTTYWLDGTITVEGQEIYNTDSYVGEHGAYIETLDTFYDITDGELEIMQVLWNNENCGLAEIVAELDKTKKRNKNTVKTLLYRLVDKGAVKSQKVNGQEFSYAPTITEKKYLSKANDSFLSKLYKGNVEKLLLNFVEDKTVSKEELQKLVNMLESEDQLCQIILLI